VDFEPSEEQRAIVEAVEGLLARHAGPSRAVALAAKAEYDVPLEAALREAGFLDVAREGGGALEAALVVEAVARHAGVVAAGAAALVAPAVLATPRPGPVALARVGAPGPVRFAAHARTLLLLGEEEAHVVPLTAGDAEPVRSGFGYPFGRVPSGASGERLGAEAARRLRDWWRVALAAELAGTLRGALDTTLAYVKARRQFGRAIGSFQAVQHRLAECHVLVEGARWLALEAAGRDADQAAGAAALAFAGTASERVFAETHQLSGALGYTREHDLHAWSMRLPALRLELGGVAAARRALASARWGSG
jgi:alkylation response protein AidB-like acyl-CoA dehydrogenase